MIVHGTFVPTLRGVVEPQVEAWALATDGTWRWVPFTIDCGADTTALPADYIVFLGLDLSTMTVRTNIGGVGSSGLPYVEYATTLRFVAGSEQRDFPLTVVVFTNPADLDVPLLGRDILDQVALILDRPRDTILLMLGPETYALVPSANP